MSGDSSLGIGIGLALKSYGRAVSYVKIGRVLDLTTPFSELTFTLADKSGEGNDATLYSGRYISTDGSTDRGIVADCSAAGAGNYYLTGKVRPNAVTTAELTMDGSTDSGLTGLTADVWQTFTTATSAVTPSAVQVGYDGSTASAADWSDVKLIDSSDGSTVARWQLNESADGDLDGYPALDSSGNGYHGTHTGCAGGTGETTILQTAGMDWNKRMWFDGVDDSVVSAAPVFPATADFDETFYLYVGRSNNPDNYDYAVAQYTNIDNTFGVALQPSDSKLVLVVSGLLSIESLQSYNSEFLTVRLVRTSGTISFYINEILQGTDSSGVSIPQGNTVFGDNAPQIGNRHWLGLIYGNSVDGTVNGSPSNFLVPASDATPTNDALGNAIANPRPTTDTWNFFGDGEYGRVADADSLDLTTEATWEMWGNFYGVPSASQTLFSKYTDGANREWWIQKSTINAADEVRFLAFGNGTSLVQAVSGITDQVGHLVFTLDQTNGLKAYWNGVAMTVPAHAPILLDFATKTSPVVIGALASLSNFSDEKISRPKIYNRAFTADEVLKNYNAQKGAFGL